MNPTIRKMKPASYNELLALLNELLRLIPNVDVRCVPTSWYETIEEATAVVAVSPPRKSEKPLKVYQIILSGWSLNNNYDTTTLWIAATSKKLVRRHLKSSPWASGVDETRYPIILVGVAPDDADVDYVLDAEGNAVGECVTQTREQLEELARRRAAETSKAIPVAEENIPELPWSNRTTIPAWQLKLFEVVLNYWSIDSVNDNSVLWFAAPNKKSIRRFIASTGWASLFDEKLHPIKRIAEVLCDDPTVDYTLDREGLVFSYHGDVHKQLYRRAQSDPNETASVSPSTVTPEETPMAKTLTEIFEEEIRPLLEKICALCEEHKLPLIAVIQEPDNTEHTDSRVYHNVNYVLPPHRSSLLQSIHDLLRLYALNNSLPGDTNDAQTR